MNALFELAGILARQNDFQEMLRLISNRTSELLQTDYVAIVMINPNTGVTIKTVIRGVEAIEPDLSLLQTNIIGWCLKHNSLFLSEDAPRDERFRKDLFSDLPILPALSAPLIVAGRPIGYIVSIRRKTQAPFTPEEQFLLVNLCLLCSPHLGNAQRVAELFEKHIPQEALLSTYEAHGLRGKSLTFLELLRAIDSAAACDVRVLLEGSSGTGKELAARAIHAESSRRNGPFVAIDCGAISKELIESELFGHTKGAFTGAAQNRNGLFREADGGTLFMDEISNLSFDVQAKLLRVLQEEEVKPVGSDRTHRINVRVIAACSSPLRLLVKKGAFREDLFYRLHVYPISLPTLDERRSDIPLLAGLFLKQFAKTQKKSLKGISPALRSFLQKRDWPGNIRELENVVERLVAISSSDSTELTEQALPPDLAAEFRDSADVLSGSTKPLQESLAEIEETLIRKALEANNWNQSRAARSLQIAERTIRYKMEKLGITRPPDTSGKN